MDFFHFFFFFFFFFMAFLVSVHLGKDIESISEVGASIRWILLLPMMG
jgi:ABC-type transport system involved in cytochrome c biogenesis permease component